MDQRQLTLLLESIVERLDIPPSHYEKARDRCESLGNWLHRKESAVAGLSPALFPEGSFRLGTVIRPLLKHEEYDLDLVCEVALSNSHVTQKHVKDVVGGEVAAYAEAYGISEPVTEGNRC
ncbi:MAG: hypothetical protein IPM18_00035 [Phycisphaerales bacterium]|nr:hypothetical protein [Phycisphaerales bacterium]